MFSAVAKCLYIAVIASVVVSFSAWGRVEITKEPVLDSDKPGAEKDRIYLPELEEGPGKGYFIYYDRPKFLFKVNKSGGTVLQIKDDDGKPARHGTFELGGAISAYWRKPISRDRNKRIRYRNVTRHMIEVDRVRPSYNPSSAVTIKAKLMDKVDYYWNFRAQRDSVEVTNGFRCRNKYYPSHSGFSTRFPATKKFPPHMLLEERKASVEDWYLKFDSRQTRKNEWSFFENVKLPERASSMEVFGPWGSRTFTIEARNRRNREPLRPRMYAGNAPHQGFSLHISSIPNQSNSGSRAVGFRVSID